MMFFTTTVLSALLAASTLAAPLSTRASGSGCFEITNFSDGGSPHSVEAYISFNVADPAKKLKNVACHYSQAIQPSVATAPFGTACNDTSVSFGLVYAGTAPGYFMTIAHAYNANKTVDSGTIWLGSKVSTFVDQFNPNGNYQYLNHSANFDIAYNRYTTA